MRLTEADKEKIVKMRLDGKSYQQIATATGCSKSTVQSYLRRQGINVPPPVDYNKAMYIYCLQCGAQLHQVEKTKRKKFCCDACRMAWWKEHQDEVNRKMITRTCVFCGKEFEVSESSSKKYCSTDCYFKARFQGNTPNAQGHDRHTAAGGEEYSTLPDGCLCASCAWFYDGKRHCTGCKTADETL